MKQYVSILGAFGLIAAACGGSSSTAKEPQSIATPIPGNNVELTSSSGTAGGSAAATPTSGGKSGTASSSPSVAPQAPPTQPVAAGPCDACAGLVSRELQSALTKRAEVEARKCYERVLTNNPAARAQLSVEVRVGRDGSACDAVSQVEQPEWPGLSDCVLTEFRRGGFPNPGNNSCVIAKVPILFTPKVQQVVTSQ